MSEMIWQKRKCKFPGVVGGYTTDIDGTELRVEEERRYRSQVVTQFDTWEGSGRWNWSVSLFVHGGPCTSIEEAKRRAVEAHKKLKRSKVALERKMARVAIRGLDSAPASTSNEEKTDHDSPSSTAEKDRDTSEITNRRNR
jgi:hypothetical protein